MTEAIVSGVVNKLGNLLFQEALFLHGVTNQIELVKLQLGQMQCFLKDAASKKEKDERVKGWVKDIRDVAYETEDAIDIFFDVMSRGKLKGVRVIKKFIRKPLELYARHTLGNRISIIQAKLKIISEGRTTFGIENLGEHGGEIVRSVLRGPLNPDDDSYEIVGFKDDKRNIINQLVNNANVQRRRVVSIVGQGGLGKTTLAQKVYNSNEIRGYFETCIWLTISRDFKPIDLSKSVLNKLRTIRKNELDKNEEYFFTEVSKSLKEKKYLIVLDDVWTYNNTFARFLRALPDAGNGSRLLITSRFGDVAKQSDPASIPYELRFLTEEESLQLLLANALPHQNIMSSCSNDLTEVANMLAKKCGGLPLALVVLGGLLSVKNLTYNDWYQVLETMDWQSDCSECMQILAMSYDDLSYSLKPCFLYLACFPEDFDIDVGTLTRMWIAEEFIIPKGRETLEDAASRCLQELVQRCMLQVSDRIRPLGTIKSCRVHDLLRDVAINESKEERFLSVNPQENTRLQSRERRVAIYSINNDVMHHYAPNIRSLLSFGVQIRQGVKYRLLQVLELNNLPNKILLNEITSMIHLRYLGLRHTKVDRLPENIGRLQNLQTLDINGTGIKSVPMSLWDIKSLRHVRSYVPLNGPPKQANLSNLQTVSIFVGAWEEDFPRLDNVRYLRINNKECNRDWNPAAQMLQRMKYLHYLYVRGNSLSADVVNMNTFQSYKCIQLLELDGEWPNNLSLNASQFPCHVTILTLSSSRFEQDPMLELKRLQNLKLLCLDKATTCKKMICSRGGFHRPEELSIHSLEILEEFYVEEGSLPVLKDLCIGDCKELRMLPDLRYVPTLTKLELLDMSEELVKRTNPENGEDWHKIKHIQLISLNFINLREGNQ